MQDLKDKVVVITGGATGLGFGFAKAFGAEGAKIVLGEPREHRLQEAVEALAELGVEARSFVMDVTNIDSMEAFADFAWKAYGQVDILINNAGIMIPTAPMPDVPLEQMRKQFDVNVFGVWHGAAVFGRRMSEQGTPAEIYNVGSENSFFAAGPHSTAYVASKHAVLGMSIGMKEDFPDFIHVGMIAPGWVASELGDASLNKFAMPTDTFIETCMPQIKASEDLVVSHAFNMEHIDNFYQQRAAAFAKYAPRYEGDDRYDPRSLIAKAKARREKKT